MRKIKNARGEIVELKTGAELHTAMRKIAETDKRTKLAADTLTRGDSSLLFKRYLKSEGVTLKDAIRAFGFDHVGMEQVRALYQNDQTKPLFNTIVEDGIRVGYAKQGRAQQLIANTIPIDQQTYQWYYIDDPDKDELDFSKVGQAAPIPTAVIKIDGNHVIQVFKRGTGIEVTDEAMAMNIDMLTMHVQLRGQRMARTDEYRAVDRLLNGYFADGSDAAPTIGVKTANTLKLTDAWYAAQYMQEEYGFTPNLAIMNLKTAEAWAAQKEDSGQFIFLQNLTNGTVPNFINANPFVSAQVPDNRIILVDTNFALLNYQFKPLSTETDRNPKTQVTGSYTTVTDDYVPFQKNARLIMTLDEAR
nr:MAG TPA: head protein [Caudoviricetes sp.]